MMRYNAPIKHNPGRAVHGIAKIEGDIPVILSKLPNPIRLQISEQDKGFFLFYIDASGDVISDTWHASLKEAMAQADFEFGVKECDWETFD